MKNKLHMTLLSKLRSRKGHTLVELLVTLALISLFSMIAVVVMSLAIRMSSTIITRSRCRIIADTIDESLRGILRYSTYISTEDDTVYFLNENYSGWEAFLEAEDGFIFMSFCDGTPNHREKLLSNSTYAGFKVENFTLKYEDGVYRVSYRLTKGDYQEDYELRTTPISGG